MQFKNVCLGDSRVCPNDRQRRLSDIPTDVRHRVLRPHLFVALSHRSSSSVFSRFRECIENGKSKYLTATRYRVLAEYSAIASLRRRAQLDVYRGSLFLLPSVINRPSDGENNNIINACSCWRQIPSSSIGIMLFFILLIFYRVKCAGR